MKWLAIGAGIVWMAGTAGTAGIVQGDVATAHHNFTPFSRTALTYLQRNYGLEFEAIGQKVEVRIPLRQAVETAQRATPGDKRLRGSEIAVVHFSGTGMRVSGRAVNGRRCWILVYLYSGRFVYDLVDARSGQYLGGLGGISGRPP